MSDSWRLVVPVIDAAMFEGLLGTVDDELHDRVIAVDNCAEPMTAPPKVHVIRDEHNLGVARSWNAAVDVARAEGDRFVLLASASVRFGVSRARDIDELVVQASPWGMLPSPTYWHTALCSIAWWDRVGRADENFYPAYYEDCDLIRRAALLDCSIPYEGSLDVIGLRDGHGVDRLRADFPGISTINYDALADYWLRKWGCHQNDAPNTSVGFAHPYGDESNPVQWWEPVESIPALRSRYGIVGR